MGDVIRVVAWDDPRCVQPLEAAGAAWKGAHGDDIEIIRRPLTAFNDQPLAELAPICDVMIIDYPHIAQALDEGAITPIVELAGNDAVRNAMAHSIGPAQESFQVNGVANAFASDAACHVASYRPERFAEMGVDVPVTWDDVFALNEAHSGSVAVALYSTDAISCLMSLTAGEGAGPDGGERMFPNADVALRSVECLSRLAALVGDFCYDCTPQDLFAEAENRSEIAYIPFTFGYTRKVKPEEGGWRFRAPPQGSGSLLGGAGMAVSSETPIQAKAAEFAAWYCSDAGQLLAGRNWGQPSGLAAWDDAEADALTFGFYSDTRDTQANAYVRPRRSWWPAVQDETGRKLAEMLRAGAPAARIVEELEAIYTKKKPAP